MTQTQEAKATMTDAELIEQLETFEDEIGRDQKPFNAAHLWAVAMDPKHQNLTGDAFLVMCAIASLMKHPALGVRASHKCIARRASALKRMFMLADSVGWDRIAEVYQKAD